MKNRSLMTGGTLAILAVLFVAVVILSNVLFRGARLDLTENRLYTLSDGAAQVLSEIDEPLNLYFFFSERTSQEMAQLQPVRTYAARVRELLEEMAAKSGGKLRLHVIDPLPFSEEEDRASAFGLQAVPVSAAGENIYFGLAGTNSTDGQMVIPFFQPDKEAFLEYDIVKLVHGLVTTTKPIVGLLSGLDIGPSIDQQTRQMRRGWAIQQSLAELFELRPLDPATTKAIDPAIRTLVLVHPKELPEELQFALDQFVLGGGKLLVFVDPNAELDTSGADPSNPSAAMFADKSSDLGALFKAWGVEYDRTKVLLDAKHALTVQGANGAPVRHLAILGVASDSMNQDDVVTAQLASVNFSSAGVVRVSQGSTLKLVPLVQSSGDSMLVASDKLRFVPDPAALFAGFVPSGEHYVIAGRLQGPLKSAFPGRSGEGVLAESKAPVDMLVVADTDVLSDRLWVQVQQFFQQQVMNAFASNGDFAVNAVDNLTGSSALISVRGRATSARPFETVDALRRGADDRFRAKERELNEELAETERKLNDLQRGKADESSMILSPEQKAELTRFQERKLEIRKELRRVRRELDAEIHALGTRLKLLNILLIPLIVIAIAVGFWWARRRTPAPARA